METPRLAADRPYQRDSPTNERLLGFGWTADLQVLKLVKRDPVLFAHLSRDPIDCLTPAFVRQEVADRAQDDVI
jgi:hypothetical protein